MPLGKAVFGELLRKEKVDTVTDACMAEVEDRRLILADDRKIEFDYAMIMPPNVGQDVVRACTDITDAHGFVNVRETQQTVPYDNVYAVGVAAAVALPWQTPMPIGIPTTGLPTEVQARVAARNIASQVKGERPRECTDFATTPATYVIDAGNNGVIIFADHLHAPRNHGVSIPRPQARVMKLGFEKYSMWKAQNGHVMLP